MNPIIADVRTEINHTYSFNGISFLFSYVNFEEEKKKQNYTHDAAARIYNAES